MESILKATRFIRRKAIGLHIAALRAGVSAQRKHAMKLKLAASAASAAEREAIRQAAAAHKVADMAAKHEHLVWEAARAEAERIGGKL